MDQFSRGRLDQIRVTGPSALEGLALQCAPVLAHRAPARREDFLAQGAQAFDNLVKNLAATIDGRSIDLSNVRYTTGLVTFTGDPSLTATLDSCVTGSQQVGVADGWFVLLRLSSGDHTLVVTATAPSGHATSQTFLLHVQGEPDDD